MHVPARVITGFQGAEINPIDHLYVVRNSDAHAWAEYWQPDVGWVRADPTAAVAPERIDRTRPRLRNLNGVAGRLAQLAPAWLTNARAAIDAANHRWNVWVLAYSRDSQIALLSDWGWETPDSMDLIRLCISVVVGLSLVGAMWLWWARPRIKHSPWLKTLSQVHRTLSQAGVPPPTNCPKPAPALAWVRQLQSIARPTGPSTAALIDALQTLDALRYSLHGSATPKKQAQVPQLLRQIEQQAHLWRQERAALRVRGEGSSQRINRAH